MVDPSARSTLPCPTPNGDTQSVRRFCIQGWLARYAPNRYPEVLDRLEAAFERFGPRTDS